jgi:predicted RND superfamily exporter protein
VVYTGLVPLVNKAQRSLLQGLIWGFISDLVLITAVMMIAVRDWSAGLILALPSIFPAAVVFGVMGWTGVVVDIGTVMAPSVALGVTVDDVVHFMIQYRGGLMLGLNRYDSVMLAYKGCATAMYQSWGVIGLGLSVFALSPFIPTQRFGCMMITLLTSALVGNLLLLPALLASPIGGLFGRRYVKRAAFLSP